MGAITQAFEEGIARYLGLNDRHVLATNTGTSALHLGLLAAGVGPGRRGDHAGLQLRGRSPGDRGHRRRAGAVRRRRRHAGTRPRQGRRPSSARARRRSSRCTSAAWRGRVKDLYALAERRRLRIVEDATHAFGTRVDGRPIGSFGDVTCFSLRSGQGHHLDRRRGGHRRRRRAPSSGCATGAFSASTARRWRATRTAGRGSTTSSPRGSAIT